MPGDAFDIQIYHTNVVFPKIKLEYAKIYQVRNQVNENRCDHFWAPNNIDEEAKGDNYLQYDDDSFFTQVNNFKIIDEECMLWSRENAGERFYGSFFSHV